MIFSVAELLDDLSQVMGSSPGDVVNTGTTAGRRAGGKFPYLVAGDVDRGRDHVGLEVGQRSRRRGQAREGRPMDSRGE